MENGFEIFQLVALAVFGFLFFGRSLQLLAVGGINPFHLVRGKGPVEAILEGLLLIALPLWCYGVVAFAWPLSQHFFPAPLDTVLVDLFAARLLGALLVVAATALFAAALVSFGDSWRVGIDRDTPGALVTGGVFAYSRNPIFVFMDLYTLGIFLLNGRLFFALFALLTCVALHQQIRREERFLEGHYGEAYRAYCAKTARYLIS